MIKVILKEPLTHGTEKITELTIRKPHIRDIRGVDLTKLDVAGIMSDVIATLTGLPTSVTDNLAVADFFECRKHVIRFFTNSQK